MDEENASRKIADDWKENVDHSWITWAEHTTGLNVSVGYRDHHPRLLETPEKVEWTL
jgi:hypothetical protein